eukprot:COSAG05_NODE_568_length_8638_cov_8.593395_7_plen_57_part_00
MPFGGAECPHVERDRRLHIVAYALVDLCQVLHRAGGDAVYETLFIVSSSPDAAPFP